MDEIIFKDTKGKVVMKLKDDLEIDKSLIELKDKKEKETKKETSDENDKSKVL